MKLKKEAAARKLIARGLRIGAIKVLRDANNLGLKESMDICQKWQDESKEVPHYRYLRKGEMRRKGDQFKSRYDRSDTWASTAMYGRTIPAYTCNAYRRLIK